MNQWEVGPDDDEGKTWVAATAEWIRPAAATASRSARRASASRSIVRSCDGSSCTARFSRSRKAGPSCSGSTISTTRSPTTFEGMARLHRESPTLAALHRGHGARRGDHDGSRVARVGRVAPARARRRTRRRSSRSTRRRRTRCSARRCRSTRPPSSRPRTQQRQPALRAPDRSTHGRRAGTSSCATAATACPKRRSRCAPRRRPSSGRSGCARSPRSSARRALGGRARRRHPRGRARASSSRRSASTRSARSPR